MRRDIIAFGEVLWDIIEGIPNLGGAPLNFAAHARRCGMDAAIVSAVGRDELGERTRERVRAEHVGDECLFESDLPTGTVKVSLKDGIPTYDICAPVAWDRIAFPAGGVLPPVPRAFYYGTLAARDAVSRGTLLRFLEAYHEALTFYDVNLRQDYWSETEVRDLVRAATVLKLNDEEVEKLGFTVDGLFRDFPRLGMVIVTKGPEGCEVSVRNEGSFLSPAYDAGPVVDTVGAGDAFSAAFVSAILSGRSPREAAEAGNRRGGWVATRAGAIPPEPGRTGRSSPTE